MFETATFESMGTIHTRSRSWMIATFGFNTSILAALIAIPLMYPSALPKMVNTLLLETPPAVEDTKPVVRQAPAAARTTEMFENRILAPPSIPTHIWTPNVPEPPGSTTAGSLAGDPVAFPGIGCDPLNCGTAHTEVRPVMQAKPRISIGVMDGMLIYKVVPVYPTIPRAIRLEGTVELQATISRNGTIENLHVVSGPAMLQQAAIDAVRQWRYRPYLLNGEPVEVETTINVEFKLN